VISWLTWGFAGLVGWWFWLRGGDRDRGADEVEGAVFSGVGSARMGTVVLVWW
jgi:hypothetical protein